MLPAFDDVVEAIARIDGKRLDEFVVSEVEIDPFRKPGWTEPRATTFRDSPQVKDEALTVARIAAILHELGFTIKETPMSEHSPDDISAIAQTWFFTLEEIKRLSPEQVRLMAQAARDMNAARARRDRNRRITDFPRSAEDIHE